MIKAARSFVLVCVVGVGTGLFSLALGVMAASVAASAATDTFQALTSNSIPVAHLIAAIAVVCLSISALRMVSALEQSDRPATMKIRRQGDAADQDQISSDWH